MEQRVNEFKERLNSVENRINLFEEKLEVLLRVIACDNKKNECENELVNRYGEYVDKTVAAGILGVTRATVYTMLSDGRIEGACSGSKVSVRSIARHLASPRPNRKVK